MSDISISEEMIDSLEDCAANLNEIGIQISALYDTIKSVKDEKDREGLLYVYKQTQLALNKHAKSFNQLIRVVRKQIEANDDPAEKR